MLYQCECGQFYNLPDGYNGKVRCPKCGRERRAFPAVSHVPENDEAGHEGTTPQTGGAESLPAPHGDTESGDRRRNPLQAVGKLNRRQRVAVWIGGAALVVMLLVPPWQRPRAWLQLLPYQVETTYGWRTRYTVEVNSYYRPIFASEGGDVALGQLAVQCLAVVVATVLAVFVLGGLPKQGDRLRNAQ